MRLLVLAMSGGEMRLTSPGKGRDDNDNPLHFSGEIKDWLTFKSLFFARQIKDETGTKTTQVLASSV